MANGNATKKTHVLNAPGNKPQGFPAAPQKPPGAGLGHGGVHLCVLSPNRTPLPEVRVTLLSKDGAPLKKRYSRASATDRDGYTHYLDLPPGEYAFEVHPPAGHKTPDTMVLSSQIKKNEQCAFDHSFTVEPDENIAVFLVLKQGEPTVKIRTVFRPGGGKDPEPLENVSFELFQDGKLGGSTHSGSDGGASLSVPHPGLVKVVPASWYRNPNTCGGILRPVMNEMWMMADAGACCELEIAYCARESQMEVGALLEREICGQVHRVPLSGVSLTLYRGTEAAGPVLAEGTTPATFLDLEPGPYMLVASGPSVFDGRPIYLAEPCGGVLPIYVCAGQELKLINSFTYRERLGRIRGSVLSEEKCVSLPQLPLILEPVGREGEVIRKVTEPNGEFFFDVSPGTYIVRLEQEKFSLPDGTDWIATVGQQTVTVNGTAPTFISGFVIARDIHEIHGTAKTPDGGFVPFLEIEIVETNGTLVATTQTDDKGFYSAVVPRAANYLVVPKDAQRVMVAVNSKVECNFIVRAGGGGVIAGPGGGFGGGQVAEAVIDQSAYPILTEEVGYAPSPLANLGGSGTTNIGATATRALQDVLGWKLKSGDSKGFLGALTQSFALKDVEGHIEAKWTPRTYAVQSDLSGGVTGAQASIYNRAKEALDQSLPLVDGLYSLRTDANPEDVKVLKSVLRTQFTELVNELGIPGGPRISRVNQYFELLLGQQMSALIGGSSLITEPDAIPHPSFSYYQDRGNAVPGFFNPSSTLGTLRDELGLWSVYAGDINNIRQQLLVNTVDDEQDVTNFRVVVDYVTALAQSWINNQQFFPFATSPANATPFYGTQLVLLSRQLSVIAEDVDEVRFAMDSVFLGPAERQTLQVNFGSTIMFFEDFANWVQSFAQTEGPQLIQSGGKFAVQNSFLPVVLNLRNLLKAALLPGANPQTPKAFKTPRVQRALWQLEKDLVQLISLATPIKFTLPTMD